MELHKKLLLLSIVIIINDGITIKGQTFQEIVCERHSTTINCDMGVICILSANYGRTNKYACGFVSYHVTNCTQDSSLNAAKDRCDGKYMCQLYAGNSVFGDPCNGTGKYLNVSYKCQNKTMCTSEGTTPTQTFTMPTSSGSQNTENTASTSEQSTVTDTSGSPSSFPSTDLKLVGIVVGVTLSIVIAFIVIGLILRNRHISTKYRKEREKTKTVNSVISNRIDDPGITSASAATENFELNISSKNAVYAVVNKNNDQVYSDGEYGTYDVLGQKRNRRNEIDGNIYDHSHTGHGINDSVYDHSRLRYNMNDNSMYDHSSMNQHKEETYDSSYYQNR